MQDFLVVNELASPIDYPNVADLSGLGIGQFALVGDGVKVLGLDVNPGELIGIKSVQFITKYSNKLVNSVAIPRQNLVNINLQLYNPTQPTIKTIGGTTAATALDIATEGEGTIVLQNLSYNHAIATQTVRVNETKKPSETPLAYLTRVVNSLNTTLNTSPEPFAVASLVTTNIAGTAYYCIRITTTSEHVDLAMGRDGIFADAGFFTEQNAIVSTGKGVDMLQMEKDAMANRGRQNYESNPDLWYSQPTQINPNNNYDVITLNWTGLHPTPTANKVVANNHLTLAIYTGAGTTSNTMDILNVVFGHTYTITGGVNAQDVDTNELQA
jgi:hypothetical protein